MSRYSYNKTDGPDRYRDAGADSCSACDVDTVDAAAVARVMAGLPSEALVKALVDIQDAIADPTRTRILLALAIEELCVCDIAAVCGVSQSAISHQLRLLRDRNLVTFARDGRRAIYRIADDHVRTVLTTGLEHAEEIVP
ncbi:MAG: metalloregulator ArsR/SmtB family transcription factor [Coriobacteriia bacterium]|nr:metalloregulator ArsR/SmtB family transcription factor [Coriobacteriia bacterium]